MTNVDDFILKNGYGCNTSIIAGDTVPTITAMIEKGQPDLSPESTPSLLGEVILMRADSGERLLMLDGPTLTARRTAA